MLHTQPCTVASSSVCMASAAAAGNECYDIQLLTQQRRLVQYPWRERVNRRKNNPDVNERRHSSVKTEQFLLGAKQASGVSGVHVQHGQIEGIPGVQLGQSGQIPGVQHG